MRPPAAADTVDVGDDRLLLAGLEVDDLEPLALGRGHRLPWHVEDDVGAPRLQRQPAAIGSRDFSGPFGGQVAKSGVVSPPRAMGAAAGASNWSLV